MKNVVQIIDGRLKTTTNVEGSETVAAGKYILYCLPGTVIDIPGRDKPILTGWVFSGKELSEQKPRSVIPLELDSYQAFGDIDPEIWRDMAKKYGTYIKLRKSDF